MDEPEMGESTTSDGGGVADQLRRYADAAEALVTADGSARRRSHLTRGRLLVAAAVIAALLAGGSFVLLSNGGPNQLDTLQEPLPDPAPDLENSCPAPATDGPRIEQLRVALPAVMVGSHEETTSAEGRVDSMSLTVGDGGAEIRVSEVDEREVRKLTGLEATPADFEVCDPFAASERRTAVSGHWLITRSQRLQAEFVLADGSGGGWRVTVNTPLDGRDPASEQRDSARAELRRLIAGMWWPAPFDEHATGGVCSNSPRAAFDDFQLVAVPKGYVIGKPATETTPGGVDSGGEQWTRLPLSGPNGAKIDVISVATSRFTEGLANNSVGTTPGTLTIQRCRTAPGEGGTVDASTSVEETVEIRRSEERIVVGAQESEYGGWMVIGTGGASEVDVVAVAEALRSPSR